MSPLCCLPSSRRCGGVDSLEDTGRRATWAGDLGFRLKNTRRRMIQVRLDAPPAQELDSIELAIQSGDSIHATNRGSRNLQMSLADMAYLLTFDTVGYSRPKPVRGSAPVEGHRLHNTPKLVQLLSLKSEDFMDAAHIEKSLKSCLLRPPCSGLRMPHCSCPSMDPVCLSTTAVCDVALS